MPATATAASAARPAAAKERVVYHFVGQASARSHVFSVDDHWAIRWTAEATGARGRRVPFTVTLHEPGGRRVGTVAHQVGPGQGTSEQPEAGQYYLRVQTTGRWIIDVIQLDPPEAVPEIVKYSTEYRHRRRPSRRKRTINDIRYIPPRHHYSDSDWTGPTYVMNFGGRGIGTSLSFLSFARPQVPTSPGNRGVLPGLTAPDS